MTDNTASERKPIRRLVAAAHNAPPKSTKDQIDLQAKERHSTPHFCNAENYTYVVRNIIKYADEKITIATRHPEFFFGENAKYTSLIADFLTNKKGTLNVLTDEESMAKMTGLVIPSVSSAIPTFKKELATSVAESDAFKLLQSPKYNMRVQVGIAEKLPIMFEKSNPIIFITNNHNMVASEVNNNSMKGYCFNDRAYTRSLNSSFQEKMRENTTTMVDFRQTYKGSFFESLWSKFNMF
ncbi:MAG TPA: hypothetical protein VGF14_00390 [Alphaproteobacteria bacterium]